MKKKYEMLLLLFSRVDWRKGNGKSYKTKKRERSFGLLLYCPFDKITGCGLLYTIAVLHYMFGKIARNSRRQSDKPHADITFSDY